MSRPPSCPAQKNQHDNYGKTECNCMTERMIVCLLPLKKEIVRNDCGGEFRVTGVYCSLLQIAQDSWHHISFNGLITVPQCRRGPDSDRGRAQINRHFRHVVHKAITCFCCGPAVTTGTVWRATAIAGVDNEWPSHILWILAVAMQLIIYGANSN